jgi:hypothetical protein
MCFSNCLFEKVGGDSWGECGNYKAQNTPSAHCYEPEEEEKEEEDEL